MTPLASLPQGRTFLTRNRSFRWAALLGLFATSTVYAQAPTWATATSGNNNQPSGTSNTSVARATATDPATGNVYVTGSFNGTVTFGNIRLVRASSDIYVAKWDVAAGEWTSAVRGGGTSADVGNGIAVVSAGGVASVYVTGSFTSGTGANIAGTTLAGTSGADAFVAKYTDSGAGLVTTNGGALSGGGVGGSFNMADIGTAVAVGSAGGTTTVYITGTFASGAAASFAGTSITSAGGTDIFVARYTDPGTGLTNGGAIREGSAGNDNSNGIAVSSSGGTASVYVTGNFSGSTPSVTIAGTPLNNPSGSDLFVARYTDTGTGLTSGGAVRGGGAGFSNPDAGNAIAARRIGSVVSVYVTGYFTTVSGTSIAGTMLTGAGGTDMFVAKYTDSGTGLTDGGAVRGGGTSTSVAITDAGNAIALGGTGTTTTVYVTGLFASGTSTSIAGTALTGAGGNDVFVAQYADPGTGLTDGGAVSGGGTDVDTGNGIALSGTTVYVGAGVGAAVASFGSAPVLLAPVSSVALARLDATTFGYLGVEGPLQGGTSATRAVATDPVTGNVYTTGVFTGTVGFGNIRLTSAGGNDVFVAKWDMTAGEWTSAVSGGGTSADQGNGIAVRSAGGVASVYVTGTFTSATGFSIAGTPLNGAGNTDAFVAKYTDAGAGLTTTNGGAVSGGGTVADVGNGIAVGSAGGVASVYVTGTFTTSASIANSTLTGTGTDAFVAKYTDPGTGLTTTNGGAVSAGGSGADVGNGVAVSSAGGVASVYVTGSFTSTNGASIAGTTFTAAANGTDAFVAKYTDSGTGLTTTNGGAVSGGGSGADVGNGVAVSSTGGVTSVYATGTFTSTNGASIAGTTFTAAANGTDAFVAKYTDPGTGLTTTNGGAVRGGGTGADVGNGIAVGSTGSVGIVYVTGSFTSTTSFSIAGTTLAGAGGTDVFVAKYTDMGAGLLTTNGGAVSGGGTGADQGLAVALVGQRVSVGGSITPSASFGATTLALPASTLTNVLGRIDDLTLTPLPVQLVAFAATATGAVTVQLEWATASEKNSAYFEVERSLNGINFARIGAVTAAGSSATGHTYAYYDEAALAGLSYYRLRQVDLDGTATYSPVRATRLGTSRLTLYPNPAPAGATALAGLVPGTAVQVLDATGRTITTATADATGTARLALPAGLPPGVYMVRGGGLARRLAVE